MRLIDAHEVLSKMGYAYHHTATMRGYTSRKTPGLEVCKYNGRFGVGYIVIRPRYDTSRYVYIDYMLKEVR